MIAKLLGGSLAPPARHAPMDMPFRTSGRLKYQLVDRERRIEGVGLAGVSADRLDAPAVDVSVLDQELQQATLGPREIASAVFYRAGRGAIG